MRPTSDDSKKAAGNFRPVRSHSVPKLSAKAPTMPEWLPESAQEVWKYYVPEMAAAKMLTTVDLGIVAMFCVKMGEFNNTKGADFRAADLTQLRMMMAELGLTPASRLKTPPLEEDKEEWTPPQGGNVVTIAGLRSSMRNRSVTGPSTPADTSGSPAKDN